ncbi:AN protein [Thysanoplusia orichalcea nucleopolyhedrovirus]|uniref:AN protein n=1 Tax=Thysanoplusia orichalcea nucleopolyhedrovirus TaxID=101850 RepID=L0CK54_9ABAC|nr:AN protein [Thysanoplusia orichalcea nucleopolyhedrovirus]AGA16282.1 AN protein [Thysanoplusia orichalcea nucleopolyhedrovirus]
MFSSLTSDQKLLLKKYKFNNYIKSIELSRAQLAYWRSHKDIQPKPLNREEILRIESATRGQSKNELWTLLRLDRNTASASSNSSGNMLQRPALLFGNAQENYVKETNGIMFDHIRKIIERKTSSAVTESVLDCGMFFSPLGLHAASPDAYFFLANGTWIPVEIKCPYNYRDTTAEQMRLELGDKNRKYRVNHTALLVNKRGTPQYEMVKTNAHYKQMQRQMYVMNAPMGFYVVKFKHDLVVVSVPRDETFCNKELAMENNAFVAFAVENSNSARFQCADKRRLSFKTHSSNHNYSGREIDTMVNRGIYLDYGHLKCAYCNDFDTDSRENYDSVLKREHVNCKSFSVKQKDFHNPAYFDYVKRLQSVLKSALFKAEAKTLAYFGYYLTENETLQTFCCGQQESSPIKHLDNCAYYLEIFNK